MVGEEQNADEIPRRLEDGWHFRADWRNQVVERYLVNIDMAEEPRQALAQEEDCYVRQLYLYRRTGKCMNQPAFAWAYQCHSRNRETGAGSLIKAATIAREAPCEIAARLRTTSKAIAVYQKLYFAVSPVLDQGEWMATVVFPEVKGPLALFENRERRLMAAAYLRGKLGLDQALTRKVPLTAGERDELAGQIRGVLTSRAFEFISSLQHGFVPAGPEDLERLMKLMDTSSRLPQPDERDKTMSIFLQGFHGAMKAKAPHLFESARSAPGSPNRQEDVVGPMGPPPVR